MFSFFKKKKEEEGIVAIAAGRMFPLDQVKDEVFSSKMMGEGVAFELQEDVVCAPVSGELSMVFATGHAFGMAREDGVEFLVHIGIDTVQLDGEGFEILVQQGSQVKAGDPIIRVNRELVRSKGYDLATMLIVTEPNGKDVTFGAYGEYERGAKIGQ